MNKKIIVFDVDGVIFDSISLLIERSIIAFPDMTVDQSRALFKGNVYEEIAKVTLPRKKFTAQEQVEYDRLYTEKKSLAPIYTGIKECILRLSQQFILVINSSGNEENIRPLLEKEGVDHFFSFIATREVSPSKIEKFLIIADKFNITLRDMVFITDSVGDIKEAERVNVPTIAVTWGIHSRDEFLEEPHHNLLGIVDNVDELEELILKA